MATEALSTHPLRTPFTFWYLKRQSQSSGRPSESYEKSIGKLGSCATAEGFWAIYSHIVRPGDVNAPLDFHLFRENVKPMWEDPENQKGGRFIIRVPRGKQMSSKYWEDLLLSIIGGQFDVPEDEICGAVISARYQVDMLSLWVKRCDNEAVKRIIEHTMKRVLHLPHHFKIEFRAHDDSISQSHPGHSPVNPPAKTPQKRRQPSNKDGEVNAEEKTDKIGTGDVQSSI